MEEVEGVAVVVVEEVMEEVEGVAVVVVEEVEGVAVPEQVVEDNVERVGVEP